MKKRSGTIRFIIILIIIITLNLLLYKNIDFLIPIHENEVFAYENNLLGEKEDFIYDIFNQINDRTQLEYNNANDNTIESLKSNEVAYHFLYHYFFDMLQIEDEEEIEMAILELTNITKLENTIYGDLNVITVGKRNVRSNMVILYSDNMDKFYYLDGTFSGEYIFYNDYILIDSDGYEIKISNNNEENNKKNKEDIIENVKKALESFINDYEFDPDTILYRENYYILKDSEKDTTVYYYAEKNVIFGFYYGFGK